MKYVATIVFSLLGLFSSGQKKKGIIELSPYFRYDSYPEFLDSERPVSSNYITLRGISFGIDANYKLPVDKNHQLSFGLGFYRLTYNKIKHRNTTWGNSERREIAIISPLLIPHFTHKYWYNTVSINVGAERNFAMARNWNFTIGAGAANYFTFSQYYKLSQDPGNGNGTDYKKRDKEYIGLSTMLLINMQKRIKRFSIGPKLLVPIYDRVKKDENFPSEQTAGFRSKWLRGVGAGIFVSYQL